MFSKFYLKCEHVDCVFLSVPLVFDYKRVGIVSKLSVFGFIAYKRVGEFKSVLGLKFDNEGYAGW